MTELETVEPQVALEERDEVVLQIADGLITLDESGTQILTVKATALSEGVWNGIYFKPDDIKANLHKLDGSRVLISHTYEKPSDVMGWVESVDAETGEATLRIFDQDAIKKIQDGEYNAVSVGVLVQQNNGVASILDFNEISLTGNPACATCVISSYTEKTLENEDDTMTEEEITTTEELEENCECEGETLEEVPIVEDSSLQLENDTLKAELEAMKENIEVLRQHKEMLELEKKTAERGAIVEELVNNGQFKPANKDSLQALLMSFNEEQMSLFSTASDGFGPVVLEEDLGEVDYIPPEGNAQTDLERDIAEFRAALGARKQE